MSIISCWRPVAFDVSFSSHIREDKYMFGVPHWTTVDGPCIRFLDCSKCICNMNCAVNRIMAGALSADEDYTMI